MSEAWGHENMKSAFKTTNDNYMLQLACTMHGCLRACLEWTQWNSPPAQERCTCTTCVAIPPTPPVNKWLGNAPQEQEHLIAPLLKSKWAISWTPGSVKLDVQKPLMLLLWGEIEISL